jgi:hypothetical protein
MATLTKKTLTKKVVPTKVIKKTVQNKSKERIFGHAKGKIIESPDCWDEDFNN